MIASFKNINLDSDAKTSIKLIATNLIANGKVSEGVEILCLIGLVLDACRYLQDNNDWEKAAFLAKFRLTDIEYISIIKRWCDHLVSLSQTVNLFNYYYINQLNNFFKRILLFCY